MFPPFEDGPLPVLPDPADRRALREGMGLTIIEAARELKVSRWTYSGYERGLRNPRSHATLRAYYAQLYRWWRKTYTRE